MAPPTSTKPQLCPHCISDLVRTHLAPSDIQTPLTIPLKRYKLVRRLLGTNQVKTSYKIGWKLPNNKLLSIEAKDLDSNADTSSSGSLASSPHRLCFSFPTSSSPSTSVSTHLSTSLSRLSTSSSQISYSSSSTVQDTNDNLSLKVSIQN